MASFLFSMRRMLATVAAATFLLTLPGFAAGESALKPDRTAFYPQAMFRSGNVEAAREAVMSLLEAHPDDADSLALLGEILFRQAKFSEAAQAYHRAIECNSTCARAHWGLARIELLGSNRGGARDRIARAYQLDPSDPDIVLSYADFVTDPTARIALLRNFLTLATSRNWDRARLEDAAARLQITERLGRLDLGRLASGYQAYRFRLNSYFPDDHTMGGLLLKVRVNGSEPLNLILDSGADGIFVAADRVRRAGLERLTADQIGGAGPVPNRDAYIALARHINIGALALEDSLVHVIRTSPFPNADGAIGMNVFEKFLMRLDPVSKTLELAPFTDGSLAVSPAENTVPVSYTHLTLPTNREV